LTSGAFARPIAGGRQPVAPAGGLNGGKRGIDVAAAHARVKIEAGAADLHAVAVRRTHADRPC
jgi:hypothetical protein